MKVLAVSSLALSCLLGLVLDDGYHGYTFFLFLLGYHHEGSSSELPCFFLPPRSCPS